LDAAAASLSSPSNQIRIVSMQRWPVIVEGVHLPARKGIADVSSGVVGSAAAPTAVMLILTVTPVVLSWLLRLWFPADAVSAVPDAADAGGAGHTDAAVSPHDADAGSSGTPAAAGAGGVTPALARKALLLWFGMTIALAGAVAVQAVLNVTPPFDKDRVAFCMLVYGSNALALGATRLAGNACLRRHAILRESTIVAQQVVFTTLNAYLSFVSGVLWGYPASFPLDAADPVQAMTMVEHISKVHAAGREVLPSSGSAP